MKKLFKNDFFIGLGVALIAFAVYLNTLASTVQYEDCGELAAAVSTLGITHPTGYPLFTLVGWMFAHLPFDARVIVKLNVMVALSCSAAVFFFHRLFLRLLATKTPGESERSSNKIAAAAGALVLAFSATFWAQAVSFEVYALHLLFVSVLLILFLGSLPEKGSGPNRVQNRLWILFALVLGLSFTNHMMTILLAPAFLWLFFATFGFRRDSWIRIGTAAIPFLISLSLYLYLPLRASQNPILNWGNPSTTGALWKHITGAQYQHAMFSSFDVVGMNFQRFFSGFLSEFGYAPLLFVLPGAWQLFRHNGRMLTFSALLFIGCLFYSVNYNIPEIAPYFLLAYIATAIWIVFGIRAVVDYPKGGARKGVTRIFCLSLFLWPLCLNHDAVDESRDFAVEDYARNMLASLEPGAIILTDQGEYFSVPAYYLQLVEGVRTDVVVLDKSLLVAPWYYRQLERRYPWLVQNSRPEIEAYLLEIEKGTNSPDNPRSEILVSPVKYENVIRSLIEKNSEAHPIYVTSELKSLVPEGFHYVPSGLAFRLFQGATGPSISPVEFSFRPLLKETPVNLQISSWYASAYLNQGIYSVYGARDTATAVALLRKALQVKSDFAPAQAWLQRLGQMP